MIRKHFKKALLVAPEVFQNELLTDYGDVKHISSINSIFPTLFELSPDIVIFDYDYIGKDLEKILRRICFNTFYDKLKVCCYKSRPNEKTDSLLKALGVDYLIYEADLVQPRKNKKLLNNFNSVFNPSILKWTGTTSN